MASPPSDRPAAPIDRRALLLANPFFKDLDAALIDRLMAHAVTRKVTKGTVLFRKGDAGSRLYAVCAGAVRISVPSEQGQDAIFNLVPPGEIFGEIALLDGGERTADAVAIENSELMVIERRDFVPLLQQHPEVAMKVIEILCSRLRKTSEQVEDIVFLGLPHRLAKALLQLHRRAGDARAKINITQRELSQMIGTSRESTNKQLRDWERKKWLKLERGGVLILTPAALSSLVSDDAD
jgi:CRP/FNR family transcriptional regulator, cyclic AMP receptor protein